MPSVDKVAIRKLLVFPLAALDPISHLLFHNIGPIFLVLLPILPPSPPFATKCKRYNDLVYHALLSLLHYIIMKVTKYRSLTPTYASIIAPMYNADNTTFCSVQRMIEYLDLGLRRQLARPPAATIEFLGGWQSRFLLKLTCTKVEYKVQNISFWIWT